MMKEHGDNIKSKPDLRTPMTLSWVIQCGYKHEGFHSGGRDSVKIFLMLDKHQEDQDVQEQEAELSLEVVHAVGLRWGSGADCRVEADFKTVWVHYTLGGPSCCLISDLDVTGYWNWRILRIEA